GGGVRMHQRLTKSSAKPASGPEYSVPATGCAGTKCTPAGICGAISRTTAALTEPTSETVAPGARWRAISAATAPQAPTGIDTITRSAPAAASAFVAVTRSARLSSTTRSRVACVRAVATISRASPFARAARAIEEPISPTPISARRLNTGLAVIESSRGLPGEEVAQSLDHQPVCLLGADRAAQRVRQMIGTNLPHDEAALCEESVRLLRG